MARLKQLSLFDETVPKPDKTPAPPLLGARVPDEQTAPATPPHVTRSQRKLEAQRFSDFSEGLRKSLQPHLTKPLIIKRIYGRTRYVAMKQEGQQIVLRIHRRFVDAPEAVQDALSTWLKGPRRKAPKLVAQFIHELSTLVAAEQRLLPPREDLVTHGRFHDIEALYRQVNDTYFGGTCRVAIGWGRKTKLHARSRHLGSYSAVHHRITINPILDTSFVPATIVAFVIFHELLHSRQPPGTKHPHDSAFREAERSHPDYQQVKAWEKETFGSARC